MAGELVHLLFVHVPLSHKAAPPGRDCHPRLLTWNQLGRSPAHDCPASLQWEEDSSRSMCLDSGDSRKREVINMPKPLAPLCSVM